MNKCPKCNGNNVIEGGKYVEAPFKLDWRVKLFFFWLPIKVSFTTKYCAACGFSAIQDITPA